MLLGGYVLGYCLARGSYEVSSSQETPGNDCSLQGLGIVSKSMIILVLFKWYPTGYKGKKYGLSQHLLYYTLHEVCWALSINLKDEICQRSKDLSLTKGTQPCCCQLHLFVSRSDCWCVCCSQQLLTFVVSLSCVLVFSRDVFIALKRKGGKKITPDKN